MSLLAFLLEWAAVGALVSTGVSLLAVLAAEGPTEYHRRSWRLPPYGELDDGCPDELVDAEVLLDVEDLDGLNGDADALDADPDAGLPRLCTADGAVGENGTMTRGAR